MNKKLLSQKRKPVSVENQKQKKEETSSYLEQSNLQT